jgi:hypothetical protein
MELEEMPNRHKRRRRRIKRRRNRRRTMPLPKRWY